MTSYKVLPNRSYLSKVVYDEEGRALKLDFGAFYNTSWKIYNDNLEISKENKLGIEINEAIAELNNEIGGNEDDYRMVIDLREGDDIDHSLANGNQGELITRLSLRNSEACREFAWGMIRQNERIVKQSLTKLAEINTEMGQVAEEELEEGKMLTFYNRLKKEYTDNDDTYTKFKNADYFSYRVGGKKFYKL